MSKHVPLRENDDGTWSPAEPMKLGLWDRFVIRFYTWRFKALQAWLGDE